MAARVNRKFVLGLFITVVVIAGGLAATYYAMRTSPAEHIAMGDVQLAAGDEAKAVEHYSKAAHKDPRNIPLLMKLADTVAQWPTDEPIEARKRVERMQGLWLSVLDMAPSHREAFERLMQHWLDLALRDRSAGHYNAFNAIIRRCELTLQSRPSTAARKYRGIAQTYRMERIELTDAEATLAREDLEAAVEADANDRLAARHLAHWHLVRSMVLRRANRNDDADRLRAQAVRLSTRLYEADPTDIDGALAHARVLLSDGQRVEAEAILTSVEQTLQRGGDAGQFIDAAMLIMLVDRGSVDDDDLPTSVRGGDLRAAALLDRGIEQHPGQLRLHMQLAQLHKRAQRFEAAAGLYERVMQYDQPQLPAVAMQRELIQRKARIDYADTLLYLADTAAGRARRDEQIARVRQLISELASEQADDDGRLAMIRGKMALMDRNFAEAAILLDRAANALRDPHDLAPTLHLASTALRQRGELGAAADRLQRLIQLRPNSVTARQQLIEVQLQLRDHAAAATGIETILRRLPDDRRTLLLKTRLLRAQSKHDEAVEIYEQLGADEDVAIFIRLVQAHVDAGRRDEAKQLLAARYRQSPNEPTLAGAMVVLADNDEQAQALMAEAAEAGVARSVLDRAYASRSGTVDVAALFEQRIEATNDPFRKALLLYAQTMQQGDVQSARRHLAEAQKHEPGDANLIELQMDAALGAGDYDAAGEIVRRAARYNADHADGLFFQGRLAMAQGRAEDALRLYAQGLKKRPVYSEGWRMLGDAQRAAGVLAEAEDTYRKAISQKPNNLAALHGLAKTLDNREKYDAALQVYRDMVRHADDNRSVNEAYLRYEAQRGDTRTALQARQRFAEQRPNDFDNRRALALLQAQLGNDSEAMDTAEAIIADEGASVENANTIAMIHVAAERADEATAHLRNYVRSLSDEATIRDFLVLARFLVTTNQFNEAVEAYRQAIAREDAQRRPATRELADLLFERRLTAQSVPLYRELWNSSGGQRSDRIVGLRFSHALVLDGNADEAQQVLDKVTADHGKSAETLVVQALILEWRMALAQKEGRAAEAEKRYRDATAVLDEAIERNPRRGETFLQRGQLHGRFDDRQEEAEADLRRALELNANLIEPRRVLALLYVRRGEPEAAISELRRVLERRPRHEATWVSLAEIYKSMADPGLLRAHVERAIQLFPDEPYWQRQAARHAADDGRYAEARALWHTALARTGSPADVQAIAMLDMANGQPAAALKLLDAHDAQVQRHPVLEVLRGQALAALDRNADARASFRTAIRRIDDTSLVLSVAGTLASTFGHGEAVSLLTEQAVGSKRAALPLAIAALHVQTGAYDDALKMLEQAGPLVGEHRSNQPSRERVLYDTMTAACLHGLKRYSDAVAAYRRVAEADETDANARNNLAYILAEHLDKPGDALPPAEAAVKLEPDNPHALDTLGWVQFKLGRPLEAYETIKRSIDRRKSATNCYHLGVVLLELGRAESARGWFVESRDLAKKADDKAIGEAASKQLAKLNDGNDNR